MMNSLHLAMTKTALDQVLPKQSTLLREMAQDMDVALYRRYARDAAAKVLSVSVEELDSLRTQGQIGYLDISNDEASFFGCQLLAFLLECVVPPGTEPRLRHEPPPRPNEPVVRPAAELISVNDTLTMLGIGRTKFYDLLNNKEIEHVKIGKRTLIKRASLRRFTDLQNH